MTLHFGGGYTVAPESIIAVVAQAKAAGAKRSGAFSSAVAIAVTPAGEQRIPLSSSASAAARRMNSRACVMCELARLMKARRK